MDERVLNPLKAIVGGRLGHAFGWRSLFHFAAAFNLLCAILFFVLVRDTPRNSLFQFFHINFHFSISYGLYDIDHMDDIV